MQIKILVYSLIMTGIFMSCNSKPKIIEATGTTQETQPGMVDESLTKLHKVVVNEILNTPKYSYLDVAEDGETFWIAIPKKEIEKGGTYYYRGGLKKTNFKSIEFDRVFETLYLVSDVSKEPNMMDAATSNPHENMSNQTTTEQNAKIDPPPGGISIAELFANKKKYEGQTVRVQGRCIKLNSMIMNRNWVHLQDGSIKDHTVDLTVTTTDEVHMGDVVAVEGKIALNKDFGAGYKYEIIMEEAKIIR